VSVRHAAVLGSPIAHSLSPVLHRAAYAALGLDWSYSAIECSADELEGVLAARADWAGFSCTMPLKHAALDVVDVVAPRAADVGAANTVLPMPGGGWRADNTDVDGVVESLAESGVAPSTVTVLGAGGTAQAVVAALAVLGVARCTVLVRDLSRSGAVLATGERVGVGVVTGLLGAPVPAGLVVSTLPGGAADPLARLPWTSEHAVLDVVYDPWPTPLAAAARAGGATVISGALMLLHQAAAQVALMTGRDAPVPAMRAALRAAALGCGA